MKIIKYFPVIFLLLFSCKQSEIDGIIIGDTLYVHQSTSENKKLIELIKKTINKDEKALVELKDYWCGGGAGCYDLGFVITQIIYKIGEQEFIIMVNKLSKIEISGLANFINVGLAYGDNDKNNEMDNKKFDIEFPNLFKVLSEK